MMPPQRPYQRRLPPSKQSSFREVFLSIGNYSQAVLRIMLFISVVILTVLVFTKKRKDQFVMEAIHVPPGMEAKGYDGQIISLKILDKVHLLAKQTETSKDFNEVGAFSTGSDVSLEMMGVGLSINSVVQYVESMFGITHPTISGDIIEDDGKIMLTMRFPGNSVKSTSFIRRSPNSYLDEVEQLTVFAANEILRITDPYYVAFQNIEKGKLAQTMKICRELIAIEHKDAPWAYHLLAASHFMQGNFKESVQVVNSGLEKYPSFFRLHANRYYSRIKMGDRAVANEELINAFKSSAKTADEFSQLMGMFRDVNELHLARTYLSEFGDRYPADQDYLENKIFFFFHDQISDSLTMYFDKLARLRPTTYRQQLHLAKFFFIYDQAKAALEITDEMLRVDSTYQVLLLTGDIHYRSGNFTDAEKYYRLALRKSIKTASELNDLGRALSNLGNYKEAESLLSQAIAADGSWKVPHLNLARLRSKQGRAEEAHMQILLFYDKSDKSWQDASEVAWSYDYLNLPDSAISVFKQVTMMVPYDADILNEIAFAYEKQNQVDSAMKYARKAVACDSTNGSALSTLAEVFSLRHEPDSFYYFIRKAARNGYRLSEVDFNIPAYNIMKDDPEFKRMVAKE